MSPNKDQLFCGSLSENLNKFKTELTLFHMIVLKHIRKITTDTHG